MTKLRHSLVYEKVISNAKANFSIIIISSIALAVEIVPSYYFEIVKTTTTKKSCATIDYMKPFPTIPKEFNSTSSYDTVNEENE